MNARAARDVAESANFFPVAIQHDDGRESLMWYCVASILILLAQFRDLLFCARKIDLEQNQILARVFLELGFRENFPVQPMHQPHQSEPVKSTSRSLLLVLGLFLGLLVDRFPAASPPRRPMRQG